MLAELTEEHLAVDARDRGGLAVVQMMGQSTHERDYPDGLCQPPSMSRSASRGPQVFAAYSCNDIGVSRIG